MNSLFEQHSYGLFSYHILQDVPCFFLSTLSDRIYITLVVGLFLRNSDVSVATKEKYENKF